MDNLTKSSCTLSWKAPEFDGGSDIHGYYVERCSGFSTRWIKVNKSLISATSMEIRDLVEFNDYVFRVIAENDAGLGKPSEPTSKIIAKDPYDRPGAPGTPKVTDATKNSMTITWDEPRDDGNSPITNYIVEMRAVGDRTWKVANLGEKTTRPGLTVTGLREGVQYEFRVSAVNKVGQGPASEVTSSVKFGKCFCVK